MGNFTLAKQDFLLFGPAILLLAVLCYWPLAWVALQALTVKGELSFTTIATVATGQIFWVSTLNTIYLTTSVVLITALVGYPLAYLVSQASPLWSYTLKFLILFPFWTSTLVRTYAWVVILQRDGLLVNAMRMVVPDMTPVSFLNTRAASTIGMVHIMLPFFVFPLLASMESIKRDYLRAAESLGAKPIIAFWTVFFPLSLPGLLSSVIMVLMLSIGFYIIPIVLGGGKGAVISMVIEKSLSLYPDWAVASSMGLLLLLMSAVALTILNALANKAQSIWR
ncbi:MULTISPECIES: ABC transporter permease [Mesorhizobium]|uniref:ABC transporter permease n=1 Tax=Mesorhizobium TaxID=68287 RepID=UPI0010A971CC|nr:MULTISPECIES: ABC transporter permease [Mesorhizobium]